MLDLARVAGVVPGRLHRVRGDNGAAQRQRFQQRPEVRDLVRLPGLGTLSWPMTSPVTWVTAPSKCTFFFPPALASLRSLPSTATATRAGT